MLWIITQFQIARPRMTKKTININNVKDIVLLSKAYRFLNYKAVDKFKQAAENAAEIADNGIRFEGIIVDNETADIFKEVGDGDNFIGPRQFEEALKSSEGDLTIFINSPGGDVFQAVKMVAALEERATKSKIDLVVNGLSASAATYLLFAEGINKRFMTKMSQIMIHRSWSIETGNSLDFTKAAERLDSVDKAYADLMAGVMKADASEILDLMTAETWYSTEAAQEAGLVDGLYAPKTRSKGGSKVKGLDALSYATRALLNDL